MTVKVLFPCDEVNYASPIEAQRATIRQHVIGKKIVDIKFTSTEGQSVPEDVTRCVTAFVLEGGFTVEVDAYMDGAVEVSGVLLHAQVSEIKEGPTVIVNTGPAIPHGAVRWEEDDCTTHDPDHEHLEQAWERIFGEKLNTKAAVRSEDGGDAFFYLMPNGYVVCASYPGNSAIYKPAAYNVPLPSPPPSKP